MADTQPAAKPASAPNETAAPAAPPANVAAEPAPRPATTTATATTVEDEEFPDPDEDDLDDLDDLLDDFSATQIHTTAPPSASAPPAAAAATAAAPAAGPAAGADPGNAPGGDVDESALLDLLKDDEFSKQLQAGMANLLGGMENSPDVEAQFESLFQQFAAEEPDLAGGAQSFQDLKKGAPSAAPTASTSAPAARAGVPKKSSGADGAGSATFSDAVRQTMERMRASGDSATAAVAAAADAGAGKDMLSELMEQLQAGGGAGSGDEELTKMLMGMMEELTNKDILYEPMKELHDKFPAWMDAHRDTTPANDLKRYDEQQTLVREIVARFELPTFADTNPADREYIVERMHKMQAAGSPPPDLVGEMPSAQEVLEAPEEGCNPQ